MSDILRCRDDGGLNEIIEKVAKRYHIKPSAAMRMLLRRGNQALEEDFEHHLNVLHPLKYSEIDNLFHTWSILLQKKKREIEAESKRL